jgi:hypothetical protein
MTDRTGRHADRTKQIGGVTVVMATALPAIRCGNGGYLRGKAMLEALAVDGMNVTKRQAEIDGERKERQPRATPDMVTKPAHYGRAGFFLRPLGPLAILANRPKRSIARRDEMTRRAIPDS